MKNRYFNKLQFIFIFYCLTTSMIFASTENAVTLQTYESKIEQYIQGTPQTVTGDLKKWIDSSLRYISPETTILELGSAFGRDAAYIESCGYTIERTDAVHGFVQLLKNQGHQARILNALTDDFGNPYGMIFADAVFLHFTREELAIVLNKIYKNLKLPGILSFRVKFGEGESWSQEKVGADRYFCYWQPDNLSALLAMHRFEILELTVSNKWIMVIAKKA